MNKLNLKKVVAGVAALGVASMFAGAVVAANVNDGTFTDASSLTRDAIFNTDGTPAVDIIVGSAAQPVDVVWAGNIAAAIGQKAYTTEDVNATTGGYTFNNVVVEVGSTSTSTVSGDGKLEDDTQIGSEMDDTLDNDDYSLLQDEDISVDDDSTYGANDDVLSVKDTLEVKATVAFDTDKDIADLTATVNKNDIIYTIDLDEGLPDGYDDSELSKSFKLKFMGDEYTVDSYDGSKLTLIKNMSTSTYAVGDSFTVGDYTIEVSEILDNGNSTNPYEAELNLKDSEGNIVATDVFAAGNDDVFDNYVDSSIEVDSVFSDRVKIIYGSGSKLELENGHYIKDFPNKDDELWKVTFNSGYADNLTSITVKNADSDLDFKDDDALKIGDKIELPNDFGSIEFLGLTSEDTKDFVIDNGVITYKDAQDNDESLFIYEQDTGTNMDDYTTDGYINDDQLYITFTAVDANTVAVKIQQNDEDGDYLDDDGTWTSTDSNYATDWNTNASYWHDVNITSQKNSNVVFHYGIFTKSTTGSSLPEAIAIGLKVDSSAANKYYIESTDKYWTVSAIDTDLTSDDDDFNTTTQYAGYLSASTVVDDDMEGGVQFKVNDTDTYITANVDSYTGELVDTENNDYDGGNYQATSGSINLGIHDSDDLKFGYTTYGTYFAIDSGKFTATVPEDRLYGKLFIGGGSTTTTELNGATLTLTTDGEVVSSEDGTISAKLVSKDITDNCGVSAGTYITPANWNPVTNQLVYLDTDGSIKPKIIVGGYMVNNLAKDTYGLENLIVASGDYIAGKASDGNIIVAGMDAVDTETAAKELINAIENM